MANKNNWEVAEIPVLKDGGDYEFKYQLYRIKEDSQLLTKSENREWGEVFETQKEAEQEAAKLNKVYRTYVETQRTNISPREFWTHCDKLMKEYQSSMESIVGEYNYWINPPEDEIKYNNSKE